jgi:eukaryotic-like serine/threonine-protein kinase
LTEPKQPLDRFNAGNQILVAALELPEDQRPAYIEQRCGSDLSLKNSVFGLLHKFDRLGDFLESPVSASSLQLEPGELIAGRFLIVAKIGAGGMGEVYQTEDQVLKETVALKLMRADFREDPDLETRFREEIRLARKVAHPNVCRTFDVFSVTRAGLPLLFFTMEFLQGETLAAAIQQQGALDPEQVIEIASQIAAGLDAAHRDGILHRDLKPANVMLVPAGGHRRAVIADFGLARPLEGPSGSATVAGQFLGSPSYMAPEQFVDSSASPATDIYALAVIVFEMASGRRPFPDESILRAAVRRNTEDAPLLSTVAANPPQAWDSLVAAALSRDPARRPHSAGDFIAELKKFVSSPHLGPPFVTRRRAIQWGAGVSIVAASAVLLRSYRWRVAKLTSDPLVMLVNASKNEAEHTATSAFTLLLSRQLEQSRISVLSDTRVAEMWHLMRPAGDPLPVVLEPREAREIALRAGGNLLIHTIATRKLDEMGFWLRLEQLGSSPDSPTGWWEKDLKTSQSGDAFTASHAAVSWIKETISAKALPAGTRERTPQELTTSSWEALQEFIQAQQTKGDREALVRHLRTALDLDPEFPLAASRLADVLTASGRSDEGLALYAKASEVARRRDLTDLESIRIRTLFLLDTGQSAQAEQVSARWAAEYPNDFEPLVYQATAAESQGNPEAALRLATLAVQRNPKVRSALSRRAQIYLRQGRFADADRDCKSLFEIQPSDATLQLRGALDFAKGDLAGAWAALEKMKASAYFATTSLAFSLQACHRAEQGRRNDAARILEEGIRFDREQSAAASATRKRRLLVQLHLLDGQAAEARRECRAALQEKPGSVATMEIGCLLAQAGDLPAARQCLPGSLPDWPLYNHWIARLQGEIAFGAGNAAAAFDQFSAAPDDPGYGQAEWRAYLVRAAQAAHRSPVVKEHVEALVLNPARYWFNADFTGPGFLTWALKLFAGELGPNLKTRAAALVQALANSI